MSRSFGTGDQVAVGNVVVRTGAMSALFYMRYNGTTGEGGFFVWGDSGFTAGWYLGISNTTTSKIYYYNNGDSVVEESDSATYDDGNWHHCGFTMSSGGTGTFYDNGASDGTWTNSTGPSTSSATKLIGASPEGAGANREMAHVGVWNAELTAGEVRSHMHGFVPRRQSLDVWCELAGFSPEPDWSGNGFNGTVTGSAVADHPPIAPYFGFDPEWQGIVPGVGGGGISIPVAMNSYRQRHQG